MAVFTMPKRTNDFQQLVTIIQGALAPRGAKITESAEIKVEGLETVREIDVLIEGDFGVYRLRVAVEVKDLRRKLSLPDFDSILAKYRGECRVQVDKFVIVTRRGFTKGVVEKARAVGVELLTLAEATTKDWSSVGPTKLHFRFAPHVCAISVKPAIDVDYDTLKASRMICKCCGRDHGTVREYAEKTIFQHVFPKQPDLAQRLEQEAQRQPNGQALARVSWAVDGFAIRTKAGDHCFSEITVGLHYVSAHGDLKTSEYELISAQGDRRSVKVLEGTAGGKHFRFAMPDGMQSRRVALSVGPVSPLRPTRVGRNQPCPCGSGKKYKSCCARSQVAPKKAR